VFRWRRSVSSGAPSRTHNADGTPALTRGGLAERLLEIAERDDDGEPKTMPPTTSSSMAIDHAANYVEQYGDRCWVADVLSAAVIQQALDARQAVAAAPARD
jgi:hypothetical protein